MLLSDAKLSSFQTACLLGAGVAATAAGVVAYRYYKCGKVTDADEGFVDEAKTESSNERKVLVLGLSNSGKSTLLANLSKNDPAAVTAPTQGFKVICYQTGKIKLSFWEIGGAMRRYWINFVQDTSVFVFVIDSSDHARFSEAFSALHEISGDERLKKVPIVLVANKQDVIGAKTAQEVTHAVGLDNLSRREHPVHAIATSVALNAAPHGIGQLEKLLNDLCS